MWNTNCACRTSTSLRGTLVLLACPVPAFMRPRGILTAFPAPLSGWTKYCWTANSLHELLWDIYCVCGRSTNLPKPLQDANCVCRTSTSFYELLRNANIDCRTSTSHHKDANWACRTCNSNHKPLQLATSGNKLKFIYPINKYDVWKEHKMAILTVPISLTLSPYTRFYELRNANGL